MRTVSLHLGEWQEAGIDSLKCVRNLVEVAWGAGQIEFGSAPDDLPTVHVTVFSGKKALTRAFLNSDQVLQLYFIGIRWWNEILERPLQVGRIDSRFVLQRTFHPCPNQQSLN